MQTVGGLAQRITQLLEGKHKVCYTPQNVQGDSVIVVNAIHVVFPGHTWDTKVYKFPRKGGFTSIHSSLCTWVV
jgi:large subunit ribosomal protein L13